MTPVRTVRTVRSLGFQQFQACFLRFLRFLWGSERRDAKPRGADRGNKGESEMMNKTEVMNKVLQFPPTEEELTETCSRALAELYAQGSSDEELDPHGLGLTREGLRDYIIEAVRRGELRPKHVDGGWIFEEVVVRPDFLAE